MPATIMEGQDVFTVIVQYNVAPDREQELLESIRPMSEALAAQPGFVAASVHTSQDRGRVLNYQQWEDAAAFKRADAAPSVTAAREAVSAFNPDIRHYDLAFVVDAGASSG